MYLCDFLFETHQFVIGKCQSSSMMEATVLTMIAVTKVLGQPHRAAVWTNFRPSLNSLCHFLMLKLNKHLSPKAFFTNAVVFLCILSSQTPNSIQMCCLVFEFIFLQLEQHSVSHALFLYQCEKTTLFIVRRSFWCWTVQKTFLLPRRSLLYMYHSPVFSSSPSKDTDSWLTGVGNNTSYISYNIQCRELVPHSFDSFWTTLCEYVPNKSVQTVLCYVTHSGSKFMGQLL